MIEGDKLKCVDGDPKAGLIEGEIYTFNGYDSLGLVTVKELCYLSAWFERRFELVEPEPIIPTISFKVLTWDEWTSDIEKRISKQIINGSIDLSDLIYASPLDKVNPIPFCKQFMFDDVFEDQVFVTYHNDPDSHWFINGDDTALVYNTKSI